MSMILEVFKPGFVDNFWRFDWFKIMDYMFLTQTNQNLDEPIDTTPTADKGRNTMVCSNEGSVHRVYPWYLQKQSYSPNSLATFASPPPPYMQLTVQVIGEGWNGYPRTALTLQVIDTQQAFSKGTVDRTVLVLHFGTKKRLNSR